jgi:hypothetical protein
MLPTSNTIDMKATVVRIMNKGRKMYHGGNGNPNATRTATITNAAQVKSVGNSVCEWHAI